MFYEYFNGDNGAGRGASHQTGWTGLVALLIQVYGYLDPQEILDKGVLAGASGREKHLGQTAPGKYRPEVLTRQEGWSNSRVVHEEWSAKDYLT